MGAVWNDIAGLGSIRLDDTCAHDLRAGEETLVAGAFDLADVREFMQSSLPAIQEEGVRAKLLQETSYNSFNSGLENLLRRIRPKYPACKQGVVDEILSHLGRLPHMGCESMPSETWNRMVANQPEFKSCVMMYSRDNVRMFLKCIQTEPLFAPLELHKHIRNFTEEQLEDIWTTHIIPLAQVALMGNFTVSQDLINEITNILTKEGLVPTGEDDDEQSDGFPDEQIGRLMNLCLANPQLMQKVQKDLMSGCTASVLSPAIMARTNAKIAANVNAQ